MSKFLNLLGLIVAVWGAIQGFAGELPMIWSAVLVIGGTTLSAFNESLLKATDLGIISILAPIATSMLAAVDAIGQVGIQGQTAAKWVLGLKIAASALTAASAKLRQPPPGSTAALLLIPLLFVQACPFKKPHSEPVKPSQVLVLARVNASVPIGIDVVAEVATIRARYGNLDKSTAYKIVKGSDDALAKIDLARQQFASGKWDLATTREYLKEAASTFKVSVEDGTLGIKNPQTRAEWIAWAGLVSSAIESAYTLAEQLRPLPPTIQVREAEKERASARALNPTEITEILAYSLVPSIKVIGISRKTDTVALYDEGARESALTHENNRARLAQLQH